MKITPAQQCLINCLAWLEYYGVEPSQAILCAPDRVWFNRTSGLVSQIKRLNEQGVLVEGYAKNHGPTVETGFRETRTFLSTQIVIHTDRVEMDFDFFHPWDVVGLIGHGWEVMVNKLARRKTNPFSVAKALHKRGIYA